MRLPFATRAHTQKPLLTAITHRQDVIAADEHVEIAHRKTLPVRLDQVQHGKQGIIVFFEFGALITIARIFHCQIMQTKLDLHLRHFFRAGIAQGNPDERIRPLQEVADLLDRQITQTAAMLIGHAIDQHAPSSVSATGSCSKGQRGCTEKLPATFAGVPACRRRHPANAIIAPLSVQNSSSG